MLDKLIANVGKQLVVELVGGKKLSGTLVEANVEYVRIDTTEGLATFPFAVVGIFWEPMKRSLTEENMDFIANQLRSEEQSRINCTSVSGFTCWNQYYCTPPDNCVYTFACPGVYTPAQPQGGCPAFQFYQPCTYGIYQPCTYGIYQPCTYGIYQPCGFRFFFQPCFYQFQQPCYFPFGSQCTAPGGFTCPGQAFIGIAPGQDVKTQSVEEKE